MISFLCVGPIIVSHLREVSSIHESTSYFAFAGSDSILGLVSLRLKVSSMCKSASYFGFAGRVISCLCLGFILSAVL